MYLSRNLKGGIPIMYKGIPIMYMMCKLSNIYISEMLVILIVKQITLLKFAFSIIPTVKNNYEI